MARKSVGNIDHGGSALTSKSSVGHEDQPGGRSIGVGQMSVHKKDTRGGATKGSGSQPSGGKVANIDHMDGKLISKGGSPHLKQPKRGDDTGAGRNAVAEHHVGHTGSRNFGTGHGIFRPGNASNAHRFHGTENCGALRVSGHGGAHQIGKRR